MPQNAHSTDRAAFVLFALPFINLSSKSPSSSYCNKDPPLHWSRMLSILEMNPICSHRVASIFFFLACHPFNRTDVHNLRPYANAMLKPFKQSLLVIRLSPSPSRQLPVDVVHRGSPMHGAPAF
jgi:hypothetical protein